MRIVSGIDVPLADEHVIGTDPKLAPSVPGHWRRRINPFTGRSLSDRALTAEQEVRAGMQRLRGQSVSAGVIGGLDVLAEPSALGAAPADAVLQVLPGSGLSRSGEDVIVATPRRIALAGLPVYARIDQLDAIASKAAAGGTGDGPPDDDDGSGGLFPARPRRTGPTLGEVLAAPASADLPRAAVLVAEPVTAVLQANPRSLCPPDPRDDPYDDLQRIDGCRLSLYFWPSEMRARRAGEPDYALPLPGPARRNRIAYDIFALEALMAPDEGHPWEALGVPLAVIGFGQDWTLDFIDRGAALRLGGRPRPRTPLVPTGGTPLLWQARVSQFMEQLTALSDFRPAGFAASFRLLPPVGFLPAEMIDLSTRRQAIFPAGFSLSAAPVPLDQIDLAVDESAAMAPIALDVPDQVELLVPVPASVYEPGLLETATVDPAFPRALTRYVADRSDWLVRRELVRRRRDILRDAATGQRPAWPADDLPAAEANPYPDTRAPLTCTRVRRLVAAGGGRELVMLAAGSSLSISAGDTLYAWVRVVDAGGLGALGLRFGRDTWPDGDGDFSAGVLWGDPASLPMAQGDGSIALRRQGPVPAAGQWVRLSVPADARWTASGAGLAGSVVNGIRLEQRGGTVDWGPVGRITADGMETVWIADDAPPGATLQLRNLDTGAAAAGWPQQAAGDISMVTEGDFGTVEAAGVRQAVAIRDLRARWPQAFLAADLGLLDEGGIDGFAADVGARLKATNDAIDLGFVRARADIYRVRQLMLGADAASRLVTSPALADLAVRDESARARSLDIAGYLKTAYQIDFTRDPAAPLDTRPRPADAAAGHAAAGGAVLLQRATFSTQFLTMTTLAQPTFTLQRLDLPVARQTVQKSGASLMAISAAAAMHGSFANVRDQLALPGLVERTATVAERLPPAPSVEAYNAALASKLTAINTLSGLLGTADTARPRGIALADIQVPGYRWKGANPPPAPRIQGSLADILADLAKAATAQEYEDQDVLPASSARHEADYFGAAVRAIDNSIALMRLVEGRVSQYTALLADAQTARDDLVRYIAAADVRLRMIEPEVAEARHDVGVADALLAEEQARVDALNARRKATLAQHATVVMFRRPPCADRIDEIPISDASAALAPSPLVACLGAHDAVPEEIRGYVALFRGAPVAWFPALVGRVRLIDRLEAARAAMAAARARAAAFADAPVVLPAASGPMLAAVARTTSAQATVLARFRQATLQLDVGAIRAMDLSTLHVALVERGSLADLIAGDHNRPDLAHAAAVELQQLGQVAGCLYDAFGEALPAIRLGWAEILSEYDQPAPLADLGGLPRWGELPLELRRTQQGLVDYLFSRIDRSRDEAEAAMNELVRVCLLMASHAPVDRVIPTRLVAPVPARPGARLDLAVDIRLARIGQVALVRDAASAVIARAVVEDLADGVARARITQSFQPTVTIAAGVRIELSERGG